MADLLALLSSSSASLGAQRGAAATASHNVDNANTPGYARQRAELATALPADYAGGVYIGRGATLQAVSQARDRFIEAQIPASLGSSAAARAESDALSSVSALDPDAANGLSSSLSGFYGALRALSQNPSNMGLRQAAVGGATRLAQTFNRTATALQDARAGLDVKLAATATQVNPLATQMADLNRQIRIASASGAAPNDLLDARQKVQDQLATLTGATPVPDGQGNVSMVLASGQALVSGDRAGKLSTLADAANGGHLVVQMTLADGTGPISAGSLGGTLGGVIAARDGALKDAQTSLDTLAFDFANAVNTVHSAGYALDGTTGHALFQVGATSTNAASQLSVDASVAADPSLVAAASSAGTVPGDASNLLSVIATETQSLSGGLDAADSLASTISGFGAAVSDASASADHLEALGASLNQMRESASGVSIDEEMIHMTQAQRAFEAIGKVITTTDEMLQTLLKLKS